MSIKRATGGTGVYRVISADILVPVIHTVGTKTTHSLLGPEKREPRRDQNENRECILKDRDREGFGGKETGKKGAVHRLHERCLTGVHKKSTDVANWM